MKILMLSPTLPLPPTSGSKIRILSSLREIANEGHQVDLVSLVQEESEWKYEDELRAMCTRVRLVPLRRSRIQAMFRWIFMSNFWRQARFHIPQLREAVQKMWTQHEYDVMWCNFMDMAVNLRQNQRSDCVYILEQHNDDELMYQRMATNAQTPLQALFARREIVRNRRFREHWKEQFDIILCDAEEDGEATRRWAPSGTQVWTVPNGIDTATLKRDPNLQRKPNTLLFCGLMNTTMNVDAVLAFVDQSLPLIKQQIPDVELWIVGHNPSRAIQELSQRSGIVVTGTVPSVYPYYNQATLFVAPFRFGGSMKWKLLEAMSLELPVVSTEVGLHGIDAVDGTHAIIRNDLTAFAEAVVDLLYDEKCRQRLAVAARNMVVERYEWRSLFLPVVRKIDDLCVSRTCSAQH